MRRDWERGGGQLARGRRGLALALDAEDGGREFGIGRKTGKAQQAGCAAIAHGDAGLARAPSSARLALTRRRCGDFAKLLRCPARQAGRRVCAPRPAAAGIRPRPRPGPPYRSIRLIRAGGGRAPLGKKSSAKRAGKSGPGGAPPPPGGRPARGAPRRTEAERRESRAAKHTKNKRRNYAVVIGAAAAVAAIVAWSAYTFTTLEPAVSGIPPGAGLYGDEHEHASILVVIFGDRFDFSGPSFQIQNRWIHFEAQDGTTIHRHSSGVTTGYLFETLDIEVSEDCYVFPDGREFCTNEDFVLRYYVNGDQVDSINDYVFDDQDRILITYGNEEPEEINEYLAELNRQPIVA